MARYYMHLRDGTEQILDPEGLEFPSIEALRKAVLIAARDLMTGDIREGVLDFRFRIDAEDESGADHLQPAVQARDQHHPRNAVLRRKRA